MEDFKGLCEFSCQYGYCPYSACTCQALGAQKQLPNETGIEGYPLPGKGATYSGLCSFCCNYGYCPDTACGTEKVPLATPSVSPFAPPACIAGTGEAGLEGLCSYACAYGFCPINACTCTETGHLNVPPSPSPGVRTSAAPDNDPLKYGALCDFACSRGYCPNVCTSPDPTTSSPPTSTTPEGQSFGPTQTVPFGLNGIMDPYMHGCNDRQMRLMREAWRDAARLAKSHYEWFPGGKWQEAMTMYLGRNTADD